MSDSSNSASEPTRARGPRRWAILAAAIFAALLVAAGGVVVKRNLLLERVLLDALRERGIETASLKVAHFGLEHLTLEDVTLGADDLRLRTLTARYSIEGLRNGHLQTLYVDGLHVHGVLDEAGLHFGALDPFFENGGDAPASPATFPAIPADRLEVEDTRLSLDTLHGPFTATLAVVLDDAGSGALSLTTSEFRGLATSLGIETDAFALAGSLQFQPERLELRIEPAPFRVALAGAEKNTELVGTTPSVLFAVEPGGLETAALALQGGELRLPASDLLLREIDAQLRPHPHARVPVGPIALGEIRDTRREAAFPPMSFEGEVRPADANVAFAGTLTGLNQQLEIDIDGTHDLASGTGHAELAIAELRLAADGLRPQDVVPRVASVAPITNGTLVATGELRWGGDELEGFVDLGVRDLTLQRGGAIIERINAALHIDQPWLPRMRRGQVISMARVDVGLELTNGLVTYELRPDGVVVLESAVWEFAGGTVRTQGVLDLSAPEQKLVVQVRDVDLERLLMLVNLEGLSGTGSLNGNLPVILRGAEVTIVNGVLENAPAGGTVHYAPEGRATAVAAAAGDALDDLLLALKNFHYETLRLTLDGKAQGQINVALALHGANPAHRDSQPYEFNLNVEGALGDMLRSTETAYKIPAKIQQRIDEIASGAR